MCPYRHNQSCHLNQGVKSDILTWGADVIPSACAVNLKWALAANCTSTLASFNDKGRHFTNSSFLYLFIGLACFDGAQ